MRRQRQAPRTLEAVASQWAGDTLDEVVAMAQLAIEAGKARWRWDPEVDGVAALVLTDEPSRAVVVVYADGDHEEDYDRLVEMTACSLDMGLLTDCGDDGAGVRDGFVYCERHLGWYDGMMKAEAEMAEMEERELRILEAQQAADYRRS